MYQLDVESLNIQHKYFSGDGVMCLCEFHNDTHPSMFVNLVEGFYYCFACGAKGTTKKLCNVTNGKEKFVSYNKQYEGNSGVEWKTFLSYNSAVDDGFLLNRGFTPEIIEKWDLKSNDEFVVIPLRKHNIDWGVKLRLKHSNNKVKYLTFGLQPDYISTFNIRFNDFMKDVFVTEGMFGLMRYDMLGYHAVTPLSVSRCLNLKPFFESLQHEFFISFDPDYMGYLNTAKLLYVCGGLKNVNAVRIPYDIDTQSDSFLDGGCVKSPEIYLGFIHDKYGKDKMIEAVKNYKHFIKNYKG